jgi:hypothetical protein
MRYAAKVAGLPLALLALSMIRGSRFGALLLGPVGRPDWATRQVLEVLVMTLQVGGVLAMFWSKLVPTSDRASWTLMGMQVGLGVSGSLCAGFESGFALFAGATLVVLLLFTIKDGQRHPFPSFANG